MKLRKIAAAAVCAAAAANSFILPAAAEQEADPMNIVIDGNTANTLENMLYRGVGMVSGNNSSRLLLDYKAENPEAYWEIMNYMFGRQGLEISHLKLEMGSDVNSSSGTEPSVKRTEDEPADVTRGAGYQLGRTCFCSPEHAALLSLSDAFSLAAYCPDYPVLYPDGGWPSGGS